MAARRLVVGLLAGLLLVACSDGGAESKQTGSRPRSGKATTSSGPSTEPVAPTSAPATTVPTDPPTTAPAGPPPLTVEVGDLSAGSRGLRTQALQRKLNDLHFDVGEPDGAFGDNTQMAVWAWQALNGLPVDGVINQATYDRILASTPTTMLHPELGPTHVAVDRDRQVLLAFRNGQLDLVTHVSSGSGVAYCEIDGRDGVSRNCGDAVTPPGTFGFGRRASGWEIGPLGGLYNPVYFNGGIAVHGAESVPNGPASHGCVRIPMHIAEYFPSKVDTGEQIIVFNGGSGPVPQVGSAPATAPPTTAPAGLPPATAPVTSVAVVPPTVPPATAPPAPAPPVGGRFGG